MDLEIQLDDTTYRHIGGQWVDAKTYIKPPDVIIQRLNRHLHSQPSARKTTRTAKRATRSPRRMGTKFSGLGDHDFQRGTAGTNWRRRTSLGGMLAQQLSDTTPHDFLSHAIYRRAQVYVAVPGRFDEGNKYPAAKFDFRLDETQAQYGFYIEKSDKPMDSTWDWKRLLPALTNDAQLMDDVKQATDRFDLCWCIEIWQEGELERTIEVSGNDPLVWQEATQHETLSWQTFLERLESIEPHSWCDLRLCQFMEKEKAISAGTDIANQVVDVFRALLPLYESVTRQ